MKCAKCNDTGSLSKELDGHLDCGYCDVAEERVQLEKWARRAAPDVGRAELWKIFQHGRAAAAAQ